MTINMLPNKRLAVLAFTTVTPYVGATGLNYWESSTTNSALASANGAFAVDASVLATAPSSMTQLTQTTATASVTRYQVDTDYTMFGKNFDYSQADPIPSGFLVIPINSKWYFGMAAYSRTAADISTPRFWPVLEETRVRPIVVSFAPSMAYTVGALSVAVTLEYQHGQYLLETERCLFRCTKITAEGSTTGWSGALSATWQATEWLNLSLSHRFASRFDNEEIEFDLPSITSAYASVIVNHHFSLHSSYSLSRWNNKGVRYADYPDRIGLLQGYQHSRRHAISARYQWSDFSFMAGLSQDEAIDSVGGNDVRYRLGVGYPLTDALKLDVSGFKENYANKSFTSDGVERVSVQNNGYGVSLGLTFQL